MASSISFSQFTPAPILSIPPPDFNISRSEAAIQSDDTEKEESGELDFSLDLGKPVDTRTVRRVPGEVTGDLKICLSGTSN